MFKTNVTRLLTQAGIPFETAEYPWDESDLSGTHAAEALGMPPEQVFKTLVARGAKNDLYVFCIPVCCTLDLKKAARAAGEKSIAMIHVNELLPLTGYLRGGCSPIGMKKKFPTFIEEAAQLWDVIGVSAGQRGCQILLDPNALAAFTGAGYADLIL